MRVLTPTTWSWGGDADKKSTAGTTPLHIAAQTGADPIALMLLEAGAAVDPKDGAGRTPLDYAAAAGYASLAEILQKHG